jgi:predicted PurR-regulated permease PerM
VDIRPLRAVLVAAGATIGVMATLVAWRAAVRSSGILALILVAFFVAAACEPLVNRLAARGWRRGLGAGAILGGAVLLGSAVSVVAGAGALGQIAELRDSVPQIADDLEELALEWTGTQVNLDDFARRLQRADVEGVVGNAALKLLGVLGNALAGLLISFYLIVDGPRLRKRLCRLLPQRHQGEVLRVWDLAVEKTGGYIRAKIILAGIAAAVHWIAFTVVGVPYPIPMAIWVGVVSQIVPIVGTYLAIGLPALLTLAAGKPGAAVLVVLIATIYQQVENGALAPKLTAQAVDVHAGVGFVAVLLTATAFGPAYTLLTIPVVATVQGFITAYIKTHELIDDPRLDTSQTPVVPRRERDEGWKGILPTLRARRNPGAFDDAGPPEPEPES